MCDKSHHDGVVGLSYPLYPTVHTVNEPCIGGLHFLDTMNGITE
jgi:hypothetical protein